MGNFVSAMTFNPYQFDLAQLEAFPDPSLTSYELEKLRIISGKSNAIPEAAEKLLDIVKLYKEEVHHQKYVQIEIMFAT